MALLETIQSRFRTEVGNARRRLNGLPVPGSSAAYSESTTRLSDYARRELLLKGECYRRSAYGITGDLQRILRDLNKPCDDTTAIVGYYNPVRQIVDCYVNNALSGRWGKGIELELEVDGKKLLPATQEALGKLWRWSNLDTRKNPIVELAANQGTVGLRVTADPVRRRIYLSPDHPERITDIDFDERGNVVNVLLEYTLYRSDGLGEPERPVKVREILSKDGFSLEYDGEEQLTPEQRVNPLGVCPYVLMRHREREGQIFGVHAYEGSELPIHAINWNLSQFDESTARAIMETWFATGAGDKPNEFLLGPKRVIYVKTAADVPQPTFEAMVPKLDLANALKSIEANIAYLKERQPELLLNSVKLLSGISGETLAQVLKPVEAAVLNARMSYESALRSALQIGMSYGVLFGIFDLGTGTGTADAANRAYDDGDGPEWFMFKERPALPATPFSRISEAQARKAEINLEATQMAFDLVKDANTPGGVSVAA